MHGKRLSYRCFKAENVIQLNGVSLQVLEANRHSRVVTTERDVLRTAAKTDGCVHSKIIQHRLACLADALHMLVYVGQSYHLKPCITNDKQNHNIMIRVTY